MFRILPLLLLAAVLVHPVRGPREVWRCSRFVATAIKHRRSVSSWVEVGNLGGLGDSLASRPEMIGIIEWPYVHKDWTVPERFAAVRGHYAEIAQVPWLKTEPDSRRTVSDLRDVVPGLRVVLDRTEWFQREGELALSLFVDEARVYCLAFLLGRVEESRIAMIGAIQGRNLEAINDVYHTLTKKLHGARPRDFLITVFQMLSQEAGIQRVLGIRDEYRHHRHAYFGNHKDLSKGADYNEIWADRGGVAVAGGFMEIPAGPSFRPESEIPTRKRSMYRQRYELYQRIIADIGRFSGRLEASAASAEAGGPDHPKNGRPPERDSLPTGA